MTDDDFKLVKHYFQGQLSKPYLRKFKFFYFGLSHPLVHFVLSNTEDIEFKYCEPLQATSLVVVKQKNHQEAFIRFFVWFGIDTTQSMLFYFQSFVSFLNKHNWDMTQIYVKKNVDNTVYLINNEGTTVLIARLIDTHFTLIRLQQLVNKYSSVFFDDVIACDITIKEPEKQGSILSVKLTSEFLLEQKLIEKPCRDINLVLLPGIDFLLVKSLHHPKTEFKNYIKIWNDGGSCLNYGGHYSDASIAYCVVRDNCFIFPKLKHP